jgi:hypothetical protein
MSGDTTELLIIVAAQPHRVLHGCQRERIADLATVVDRVAELYRIVVSGPLRHQGRPCRHRRVLRQCSEVDVDSLLTPPPGQRHHADRIQTRGNQVGVGVDILGGHPEEFGNLLADGADRCTVVVCRPHAVPPN